MKNEWINSQLRKYPQAKREVIDFIANIKFHSGSINEPIIRKLFASGYCYYFAVMLKDAFGGQVFLIKNLHHIIWMDENNLAYDINGVFPNLKPEAIVAIQDMRMNTVEKYKHRGKVV